MQIIFFAFSLLILPLHGEAQEVNKEPTIRVSLSPNPVPQGESTALRISVEFESAEFISTPTFNSPDFNIIGQSNSIDIVTVMVKGKFVPKRKNNYTFVLSPKKTGNLRVSDIEVEIGGKKYKAEDQVAKVDSIGPSIPHVAQNQPNQNGNPDEDPTLFNFKDPSEYKGNRNDPRSQFQLNSDFTVKLELSKNKAYVGEPIIAEYYLYDFGNLTRVDIKKWPTFNGFWKEDLEIPTRFDFQDEFVNGRRVRKALLGRFALYPLKPGKIEIDKLIVNGNFISNVQNSRGNDPFTAFFGMRTVKQATHASQEEFVEAIPLPDEKRPPSFTGAVGKFAISLNADKTKSNVNEPITLKFTVNGIGNFQSIEVPNFKFPDGFELYESNTNVQAYAARGISIDLKKNIGFDILLIPRKPGSFTIPAYDWSYFDTESHTYKTLSTKPITLEVNGTATEVKISQNPVTPTTTQETLVISPSEVKEELRYLKSISEINTPSSFRWIWKIAIIIFALANLTLLVIALANKSFVVLQKWQNTNPKKTKIKRSLAELEKKINQKQIDYSSLQKAAEDILEVVLAKDIHGLTIEEIIRLSSEKGQGSDMASRLIQILRICQESRFSPKSSQQVYESFKAHGCELHKIVKDYRVF